MKTPSRKTLLRLWFAGLILALPLPMLLLVPEAGSAQSGGSLTDLKPTTQGWYTNRSSTTDPAFNTSLPGGGAGGQAFPEEHLFVGWDGAAKKADTIFAINFDLADNGVPDGSVVTSFKLEVFEHVSYSPAERTHNFPNFETAYAQGIIACAMPEFVAGSIAGELSRAPGRDCGIAIDGVRNNTPVEGTVASPGGAKFQWTFDVTPIAAALSAEQGAAMSFSFEPKASTTEVESWRLAYHSGDFQEGTDPPGKVAKPGVLADISYTPPTGSDTSSDSSLDDIASEFGDSSSFGSDVPSFSEGGLFEEVAPEAEPAPPTGQVRDPVRLAAGVEGRPAPFWKIPILFWALAFVVFILLAGSGWALLQNPPAPRPPGAVSALISGRHTV